MKSVIYYFSGTGNNYAVAKKIAEGLKNSEIYQITRLLENKHIEDNYDLVGFIVPSYYSHIPTIVAECLKGLEFSRNQRVFTVVCCGINRGHAVEDLRIAINKCGKKVQNEFNIVMPGTYILYYEPLPKFITKMLIKRSYKKINNIIKILKENKNKTKLKEALIYKFANEESLPKNINNFKNIGLEYTVNNSCIKCYKCVQICPVNNISIEDGNIAFKDKCQQCMACIQWCPSKAIDYHNKAYKKKRYHHPDVSINDLINK